MNINKLKTNEGFCCLGVLCDLHAKETGNEWRLNHEGDLEYLDNSSILPYQVRDWALLESTLPKIKKEDLNIIESINKNISLAYLNDEKDYTFEQIADVIEKHL